MQKTLAERWKLALKMYVSFFQIGLFTFGGGYAMLPMLQREIVDAHGWATEEELADYYAIGQCTPGVIAVNTATFIGQKLGGTACAAAATLGVIFPSLVIITVIAAVLRNFAELPVVRNAFAGIRVCVCALILNAVVKLWKKAVVDLPTLIIFLAILALAVFTKLSPVIFVVAAGIAGVLIKAKGAKK